MSVQYLKIKQLQIYATQQKAAAANAAAAWIID